jgi:hypothetical protein
MSTDETIGASATKELFRFRRIDVVDAAWHLGFVLGFGLAGIVAFRVLVASFDAAPGKAIVAYIVAMFLAGVVCGLLGTAFGHLIASVWERVDLRRHPRRYESGHGGA